MGIAMAVHGGAWNIPDELWEAHDRGCRAAHAAGQAVLEAGGTAADAVAAAIRIMEDDPTFDAGYGSFLNEHGDVELDAGLMEGNTLHSGAVLGVSRVKNPIDLALKIMNESEHCIFAGEGAHALAERMGMEMVDPSIHVHPRERAVHERIQAGESQILETAWSAHPNDTVGAIALDSEGNLAAGNSTGGTLNKALGRVGDAPILGVGFYADNDMGAAICTGWGESIMRSAMAMHGLHALKHMDVQAAAEAAIEHLANRVKGFGGILLMTRDGKVGKAFNTERMASWY